MGRIKRLSPGDVFGRWTVLELGARGKKRKWLCRCVCGSESLVGTFSLTSGGSISCGCYAKERRFEANMKHGHARAGKKTRLYTTWEKIISRCCSPTDKAFPNYGGRGIKVCDEWRNNFSAFANDMGTPIPGKSVERDDVNGNYEPGNCRWATSTEQNNNARSNIMIATVDGLETMAEFARRHGLDYKKLQEKVGRGATEISGIKFRIAGRRDSMQPPPSEEIVAVVARKFNVGPEIAKRWLKKFDYTATDELLAAENTRKAA